MTQRVKYSSDVSILRYKANSLIDCHTLFFLVLLPITNGMQMLK